MARLRLFHPALALYGALCIGLSVGPASAQQGIVVTDEMTAPRGAQSEAYQATARKQGINTDAIYAKSINVGAAEVPIRPTPPTRNAPALRVEGGWGVFFVIAAFLILLLLWLRFGGSGALLSADPAEVKERTKAPEGWRIGDAETTLDTRSLLEQIRAMPDRRAALVRLLRHALLAAGNDSSTRFARSDTEREAFRRLPKGWRHLEGLAILLRAAELAHYGGRDVSEDAFSQALDHAAAILGTGQRRGHA